MKKLLFIIVLVLVVLVANGCEKEKVYPSYITAENIYELESEHYLIYFEKETCSQCAATLPSVIEYLTEKSGKKDFVPIYRVLLEFTDENNEEVVLPISRAYDKANTGQGPDGNFYVDGVNNWLALYIAAAPSLIEITNKQSKLVAVGKTEIENYLNNLQNGK